MTTQTLDGQRAWVFGGSSGIGQACALALATLGAQVIVAGRDRARLDATLALLPADARAESVDVADEAALRAALQHQGGFDHLVLSLAAGSALGPLRQLDEAALRRTFEGKFWPYMRVSLAALPHLRGAGSITWITGAAARAAIPGMSAIAATNGALHAMLGPLARELAPLRVNAVSPGFIDTPYWDKALDDAARERTYATMAAMVPAQRVGTPAEVAQAVTLCVNNGFITGSVIDCDGGRKLV